MRALRHFLDWSRCLCCLILVRTARHHDLMVWGSSGWGVSGLTGTQGAGSTDCLGVARVPVKLPIVGSFQDGPLPHTSRVVLSMPDQGWPYVTNRIR